MVPGPLLSHKSLDEDVNEYLSFRAGEAPFWPNLGEGDAPFFREPGTSNDGD